MKFMYFSIKYRYSDISLKKHKLHLSHLFCCNHTCYCVNMVSVTSVSRYIKSSSRYHSRYQSISLVYICGLIPRNFAEFAEAVPIALGAEKLLVLLCTCLSYCLFFYFRVECTSFSCLIITQGVGLFCL